MPRPRGLGVSRGPEYWWYVARTELLRTVLEETSATPTCSTSGARTARAWAGSTATASGRCSTSIPVGSRRAGSAARRWRSPSRTSTFDVVVRLRRGRALRSGVLGTRGVDPRAQAGGRLLMSVPAYQWAWSEFDEENGHHRRYTRPGPSAPSRRRAYGRCGRRTPSPGSSRSSRPRGCCEGPGDGSFARPVTAPRRDGEPARRRHPHSSGRSAGCVAGRRSCSARRDLPFGSSVVIAAVRSADAGHR